MGPYSSVLVTEQEDVQVQQFLLYHYLDSHFPFLELQALRPQLSAFAVDNCA
jgi:hypothetical protein